MARSQRFRYRHDAAQLLEVLTLVYRIYVGENRVNPVIPLVSGVSPGSSSFAVRSAHFPTMEPADEGTGEKRGADRALTDCELVTLSDTELFQALIEQLYCLITSSLGFCATVTYLQ